MPAKFTILLVEDDIAIVDLIQRVAKTHFPEANFIPITTFEEAVIYLYNVEGFGPKLALLDINLAGYKSGLDFLNLMREHPLGKLVPVVVLSASNSKKDIKVAYDSGASSFVNKPFTLNDWRSFLTMLRFYWFETVKLPQTWFEKVSDKMG
jgi:CheY-like chemotaxis protein